MSIDQQTRPERDSDTRLEQAEARADFNAAAADINEFEAQRQAMRANRYAVHNTRQAIQLDRTRRERNQAMYEGSIARNQAQGTALALWMLMGVVAAVTAAGLFLYFATYGSRNAAPSTVSSTTTSTTTIERPAASVATTPAARPVVIVAPTSAAPVATRPISQPVVIHSGGVSRDTYDAANPDNPANSRTARPASVNSGQ